MRWHALSVARMRLRGGLGTASNVLVMRHRERGARALDSSTSLISAYRAPMRECDLCVGGGDWGLGMCVIDVGIGRLTCTIHAGGVARLAVRSNGTE